MKVVLSVLKGCSGGILIGFFFFVVSTVVRAVEVKPPILELSAKAGEAAATVFLLKNTEPIEQTYVFTIQGFVAQGDNGQQAFLPPTQADGLPIWLYLKDQRVTLAAGATASIPIAFRPPVGTEAGGYQAIVFVTVVDPARAEGVTLGSRIGVLVFATVEGDVQRSMSIDLFRRASSRWSLYFAPRFEVVLRNEGRAHEVPSGRVVIKNLFGQTKERLSLQTTERIGRILPRSQRRFEVASVKSNTWMHGWGLGIYQAEFLLDEPFQTRADAGWFFVIPWKTLVLLGAGVILVGWRRTRRA